VELLNRGLRVVLAGPPNAGKSSLFNALLGTNRAIVTPVAGTTRDLIEAAIDLEGIKLVLIDTAGVRDTDDQVEQIGVDLARRAQREADLLLWLGAAEEQPHHSAAILVHARCDERRDIVPPGAVATSVTNGTGLDRLRSALTDLASSLLPPPDLAALNERQAQALGQAHLALTATSHNDVLLVAESLRQALRSLDELTGRQGTEDVLDQLFSSFCLGK
jgi:tRNA modification GTPase